MTHVRDHGVLRLQADIDRIRELEAALKEAELQRDSWKRIAESGLGISQTETAGETIFNKDITIIGSGAETISKPVDVWICHCQNCKDRRARETASKPDPKCENAPWVIDELGTTICSSCRRPIDEIFMRDSVANRGGVGK